MTIFHDDIIFKSWFYFKVLGKRLVCLVGDRTLALIKVAEISDWNLVKT